MISTHSKLDKLLKSYPIQDPQKLKKQQDYYRRLSEAGIARKQTYNLKPISVI